MEEKPSITAEAVLRELSAIGFADVRDYLQAEGNTLMIRSTQELSRSQSAAVCAIEKTSSGLKVKFYDKLRALELLGKYLQLFEGGAMEAGQNNLLGALVASTKEEIDLCDIPEIQQTTEPCHDLVEPGEPSPL